MTRRTQAFVQRRLTAALVAPLLFAVTGCNGVATVDPVPTPVGTSAEQPDFGSTPALTWPASKVPVDTVVAINSADPASLDPAWTYEVFGVSTDRMLYDPLVAFDHARADAFVPALAKEWTSSDDGTTFTFTLRKGVTFHEGGTLEPHDAAYSLQRALLQDRSSGPMWMYLKPLVGASSIAALAFDKSGVKPNEGEAAPALDALPAEAVRAACEAVQAAVTADDAAGTVTLRLAVPTPWFLQLIAMPTASILDREWMVEQGDWDGTCADWTKWHDPAAEVSTLFSRENGTGPYTLGTWKKNESLSLDAWDGYWRSEPAWAGGPSGPARIKHVVIQNVPEWGTRFAKLRSGEADTAYVPLAEVDQLADLVYAEYAGSDDGAAETLSHEDGILKLFKGYPTSSANALTFNFGIEASGGNEFIGSGQLDGDGIPPDFFADIDVRRGFIQCFDTETFIRDTLHGDGTQSRGPIIQGLQGYRPDSPIVDFDLDECAQSLSKAWDGQLPGVGFRLIVPYSEGWAEAESALDILADGLSQANAAFKLDKVQMEWPTQLDNLSKGRLPMAMTGWYEDFHDASNWAQAYLYSGGFSGGNQRFPPELGTKLDALVDAASSETDAAKRDAMFAELQSMANDNATAIWLNQALGRAYWRREVKGWYVHPLAPGTDYYSLYKEPPSP